MREIKFRAWDPEEKKMWIDVGTDGCGGVILDTEYMGLKPLKGESILMQYTGLKDKDGREIYEGDILAWQEGKDKERYEVKFSSATFWCRSFTDGEYSTSLVFLSPHSIEVIGNIYKNPEVVSG